MTSTTPPSEPAGDRLDAWFERWTVAVAFAWGLAEALAFFIVPDVFVGAAALGRLRRGLVAVAAATAGALAGGVVLGSCRRPSSRRSSAPSCAAGRGFRRRRSSPSTWSAGWDLRPLLQPGRSLSVSGDDQPLARRRARQPVDRPRHDLDADRLEQVAGRAAAAVLGEPGAGSEQQLQGLAAAKLVAPQRLEVAVEGHRAESMVRQAPHPPQRQALRRRRGPPRVPRERRPSPRGAERARQLFGGPQVSHGRGPQPILTTA